MMKKSFSALLVLLAVVLLPLAGGTPWVQVARAQMDFSLDEAETDTPPADDAQSDSGADMTFDEGQAEGGEGADFGGGGGDVIGQLAAEDEGAQGATGDAAPRATASQEEVYAVQQVYALRINRVELLPSFAFTVNDPYVSHTALGLGLNYWFTNVLAVGVNFLWYQGLSSESDLNFFVRRSTRLAVPITEWQMGAHLNFTYVPLYGKFSAFNQFIFQWDAYIVGGVGLMRTRPVPVIDPEIRQFSYQMRVAFNVGMGLRVFLSRFLTFFTEFRDYAYLEKFENLEVALGGQRTEASTWFASGSTLVNNTTVQVGFTLFFPFTFEYHLPK